MNYFEFIFQTWLIIISSTINLSAISLASILHARDYYIRTFDRMTKSPRVIVENSIRSNCLIQREHGVVE